MFDRFTDRSRKVMALARKEAQGWGHDYIGTEHILLGLVQEGSGVAANALKNLGLGAGKIREEVATQVMKGPASASVMGQLPFTPQAKKSLEGAMEEALDLGHSYIGTEHLLLGLLRVPDGVAAKVLSSLGLEIEAVRREVLALLGAEPDKPAVPLPTRIPLKSLAQGISARTFEVTGPDGKLWARLGLIGENQPELSLFDAAGSQRIVLGLDASGDPRLEMRDREGKVTFHLP